MGLLSPYHKCAGWRIGFDSPTEYSYLYTPPIPLMDEISCQNGRLRCPSAKMAVIFLKVFSLDKPIL
jgi:hypothetical protein